MVREVEWHNMKDMLAFWKLWEMFLLDRVKAGGPIANTERTLIHWNQTFKNILNGTERGWMALWLYEGEPRGCAAGGPMWDHLDTTVGRVTACWGVYIHPDARKCGGLRELLEYGKVALPQRGYDLLIAEAHGTNEESALAQMRVGLKPFSSVFQMGLREDEDG